MWHVRCTGLLPKELTAINTNSKTLGRDSRLESNTQIEPTNHPQYMKLKTTLVAALCGMMLAAAAPAEEGDVTKAFMKTASLLKGAENLSVKLDRSISPKLAEGLGLPPKVKMMATATRPNMIKISSTLPDGGNRDFYFDGKTVSLLDADQDPAVYASAELEGGTIDDLIAAIEEKYGFSPPILDLFNSKLGETVSKEGAFESAEMSGNHIKFSSKDLTFEMWTGDDSLPDKIVFTMNEWEDAPSITFDNMEWDLEAKTEKSAFTFTAPKGAAKADLLTVSEIDELLKETPEEDKK